MIATSLATLLVATAVVAPATAPSPRPARRPAAPRPAATAAPTPTPKPKTALERLVAIVEAARPTEPADDASRKILLAEAALERGDLVKATSLLDEAAALTAPLPKIDPEDKEGKRINFRRSGLRYRWIRLIARMDPVRGLQSAMEYASETNSLHHATLVSTLLKGLDCSSAERKAAVEQNLKLLLDPVEQAMKDRTWGLSNAPTALDTAAEAARACGLDATGQRATSVAAKALPVFESTDLRIRACEMAMTKVFTTAPAERAKAVGDLVKYQLKPQYKGDDPDRCETNKISLVGHLLPQVGPADPGRGPITQLLASSLAQLDDKKLKYYHCSVLTTLADVAELDPAAVDKGATLAIAAWKKGDSVQSYCDVPARAAALGRRLEAAGQRPEWLCSTLSIQPEGKPLTEADQKELRKQRALAALELRGRCPEAEAALQVDAPDLDFLKALRPRQLRADRVATEPLILQDLAKVPAAEAYDYAVAVLPGFWAESTR
jgi:hypothetical protein